MGRNSEADLLAQGVGYLRAGRTEQAERAFRKVLKGDPNHPDALVFLGIAANMSGHHAYAAGLFEKALTRKPDDPQALYNLGVAEQGRGRQEAALARYDAALALTPGFMQAAFNRALVLDALGRSEAALDAMRAVARAWPDQPECHNQLGNLLAKQGLFAAAAASLRTALALSSDYPEALNNLGVALLGLGETEEALAVFRRAVAVDPGFTAAWDNLVGALADLGRRQDLLEVLGARAKALPRDAGSLADLGLALIEAGLLSEAEDAIRAAIALDRRSPRGHCALGALLAARGQMSGAEESYRRARALAPDFAEAHFALGLLAHDAGRLDEAIACYRHVLALSPADARCLNNLGDALGRMARLDEALLCYRRALVVNPSFDVARSNFIMAHHYGEDFSATDIRALAQDFGRRFEDIPLRADFDRSPDRPLTVGFVSSDFRQHPVGHFLAGVLAARDHARFRAVCFSNATMVDAMTDRLVADSDGWVNIAGLDDEAAAERVRTAGIDILVDLSGHTAGNRLALFARRPAPLQLSWLGYFGTTGLSAMDYVIADRFVAPPDRDGDFSETVLRLPGCYLCYRPPVPDLKPGPFPALGTGSVTFGSFNNPAKLRPRVVALWSEILKQIDGSRLFLKYQAFGEASCRAHFTAAFRRHGIGADRLIFEGHSPLAEALAAYRRIDIALDPFPFGGGTTTADALWMGVPLVALAGDRWSGRISLSILETLGLADLVAATEADYLAKACALAGALPPTLKADLRRRMEEGSFCDAQGFTRHFEETLRMLWRRRCAQ